VVQLTKFKNTTAAKIEELTEPGELRPYLGCSKLGHSCDRYLWYSFRWCYNREIPARLKRLFNRGHREEPAIEAELAKIGIQTFDDQAEVVLGFGHCKGHCDGKGLGIVEAPKTVHLMEYKTMSDKYFKEISKTRSVKVSKPVYYAQMQIYMYKLKLTRAMFIAVNKNTDAMYFERVKLDKGYAQDLERKAERIILSEDPPPKKFKPTWFECRFCDANAICHGNAHVERNCRTCDYLDLHPEGRWKCSYYDDLQLVTDQQRLGCQHYKLLKSIKHEYKR